MRTLAGGYLEVQSLVYKSEQATRAKTYSSVMKPPALSTRSSSVSTSSRVANVEASPRGLAPSASVVVVTDHPSDGGSATTLGIDC